MPVVARFKTAAGVLQIDQDFKNFALVASGTVTTDTILGTTSSQKTVTLPAGMVRPIIAFRSSVALLIIQSSLTSVTFISKGGAGTSLSYYVFDEPPATALPSGPKFVLRIPTGVAGAGEIAFRSDFKYMKVLQRRTVGAASFMGAGSVGSSSVFAGKTLAVVQSSPGVRQTWDGGAGTPGATPCSTWAGGGSIALSGGSEFVSFESFKVYGFNASMGLDSLGTDAVWLILDVTNY